MAKKKTARQKATERADREMSRYIRLFHADQYGYCTCVTSGRRGYWKNDNIDAGHFMAKGNGATSVRWLHHNVFPQSHSDNTYKSGNLVEYTRFMDRTFGAGITDDLRARKHQTAKYTLEEIREIADLYKEFADELESKIL